MFERRRRRSADVPNRGGVEVDGTGAHRVRCVAGNALMNAGNDAFRFLLELAALVSVGYWGYRSNDGVFRWVLMIAAPLVVAAVWATWVAAKSSSALHGPWRLGLEVVIFGGSAVAVVRAGRPTW